MSEKLAVGMNVVVRVPPMADLDTGEMLPGEEYNGVITSTCSRCHRSRIIGVAVSVKDHHSIIVDPKWITTKGLPVTKDRLCLWANDGNGDGRNLLIELLGALEYRTFRSMSCSSLLIMLLQWRQNEINGSQQWSFKQLLNEVYDKCAMHAITMDNLDDFVKDFRGFRASAGST